ncbi:hypothetical protein DCAR_0314058 [Daucus carota subsp. sativus]|uniref:Uncharacterized protein n=1 Tax=Daucus carota subsp. sativus TaxID=79200 RepID=A0A166CE82_DAUCS|nr:PREDICTED: uncharacterized protein LOC108215324 [Daucus carota subsp. sativus]XP_017243265.1 PREDICTED: uncharacterized protein LOC108215324 [Daucus carota subsp. sativus]WOG94761.1 hypothetical protein DCAR_0314058 [Daucus carota subsp. sativus]
MSKDLLRFNKGHLQFTNNLQLLSCQLGGQCQGLLLENQLLKALKFQQILGHLKPQKGRKRLSTSLKQKERTGHYGYRTKGRNWFKRRQLRVETEKMVEEKVAQHDKADDIDNFVMEKIDHPDEKERERLGNSWSKLIGIGLRKLFMPTPGFKKVDYQHNGTPVADTPPVQEDADEETESNEEGNLSVRRSTKLSMKTKFKFSNTSKSVVNLDAD